MNTRRMLLDSFYELIQEHDFNDITVQMILDRAQVSRGTFYRHYEDKYDLMNSFYSDHVGEMLAKIHEGISIYQVIEMILQHVEQNGGYYRRIVKTEGFDSFLDFLKKFSIDFYSSSYKKSKGVDELDARDALEVEMLCGGHVAALEKWVDEGFPIPPEELARIAADFIPAELHAAIRQDAAIG